MCEESEDLGEWDDGDEQTEWSEWLATNVLPYAKRMTLQQWLLVAWTFWRFRDDRDTLRSVAPNLSKLSARDMDYLRQQHERHQHDLTDEDMKRLYSPGQLRQMRRKRASLK